MGSARVKIASPRGVLSLTPHFGEVDAKHHNEQTVQTVLLLNLRDYYTALKPRFY
jgi:hypothetical protein